MSTRTRIQVWLYDVFKLVVTAILAVIIALFFLRFGAPTMRAQEKEPTSAPVALAPPTHTPAPTPTPVPEVTIGPPTLDLPEGGLEVGEVALRGSAPGADKVQVVIDGEEVDTVEVGPDGVWKLPTWFDKPGDHEIEIRAIDGSGAVASSTKRQVNVDPGMVPLEVGVPVWGEWQPIDAERSQARLELSGTGDPGAEVVLRADDDSVATIAVGKDGTWSAVEVVKQTFGPHNLYVEMQDGTGGLLDAVDPIPFEVPTPTLAPTPTPEPTPVPTPSVPAPAITFPRNGDVVRAGPLGIRGTGEAGIEIELVDQETVTGSTTVADDGTWRVEVELSEGNHVLVARVVEVPDAASEPVRVAAIPGEIACAWVAPPTESQCTADPPFGQDLGDTWIVGRCETLNLIAVRAGVTVADILALNPEICNPNIIYEGQEIALPPR